MSDSLKAAITAATKGVTKSWKEAKRTADRSDRVSTNKLYRMRYSRPRVTIREVAFSVMKAAYNKVSSDGKFFANARQIMYAARPAILAECDAGEFNDVYFTQTLLKDYLEEFTPDWKVVWDARGHLVEPHTGVSISLGGIGVKGYMDKWHSYISSTVPAPKALIDTNGPQNRFSSVLFIEKEGFAEILTHAGIGKRFDMAIMSTKGLPVKAACDVILAMHREGVKTFVLRDFDLAGFKIVRTLREGTRLAQGSPVIDLGLRIADIKDLPSEPCTFSQGISPRRYLENRCDATSEEGEFLVSGGIRGHWHGRRVEINAMTSDQLITWLERKFTEHGIKKLIPQEDTLRQALARAVFLQRMQERIEELEAEIDEEQSDCSDLHSRVEDALKKSPGMSWDDAVWHIAKERTK